MVYCLILEFVLFMFGLLALVGGKLSFREKLVASGRTARIAGLILMAPLPLTVLIEVATAPGRKSADTTLLFSLLEMLILLGSLAGAGLYVWLEGKKPARPAAVPQAPAGSALPAASTPSLPEGITLSGTRIKTEAGRAQTYVEYKGPDAETAKRFLRSQPKPAHDTCLVVETPQGVWGWDENGLYLEHLLDWQKDPGAATVQGSCNPLSATRESVLFARNGVMDNFVIEVKCAACGQTWLDGIRYAEETAVRCPQCQTLNKVKNTFIIF